ncbi:MAG: phosphatidylglycerophosphatase A [Candidatus Omnitrophica bacterium]|nr:phosphatidylglycerophosphatase A [Candidatus Omnitrophota bacterium]
MKKIFLQFMGIVACGLGLGFFPFIPGTIASLAVCFSYAILRPKILNWIGWVIFFCISGLITSGIQEKQFKRKDDKRIVIDEFCGMAIGLIGVPQDFLLLGIAFFLFRLFDTLKVFPISSVQQLKGSWGIMLDDIIAGCYTVLVVQLIFLLNRLIGF